MNEEIEKIIEEIQSNYRENYGLVEENEIFYYLLEQIGRHIGKLARLRDKEDLPGRFKREVADMHLLVLGLLKLENVDDEVIKASADYYLSKTKGKKK